MSRKRGGAVAATPPVAISKLPRWVLPLVLFIACIALAPALRAPFEFDDGTAIPGNASLRTLWPLSVPLSPPPNTAVSGRPVVNYTLAVNAAVNRWLDVDERPNPLGPNKTVGYHVVNVALHLACALLLFGIVRRTVRGGRVPDAWRNRADWLAAGAAALWLLHPIQTEAVHYLVQRTEVLVSLCYLGTLYSWIRAWDAATPGGARRWRGSAVAICLLGMGSKEVMITAPLMVVLYDRAFRVSSWKDLIAASDRVWFYVALAATTVWTIANVASNARHGTVGFQLGIAWYAYLYSQAWAIAHYLRLIALPDSLTFDYGQRPIGGWASVPGAVLLVALAAGTVYAWRRANEWGWLAFLGAWFFLLLAPSSSAVPITTEIAAERRVYLASAAVVIALLVGVSTLAQWLARQPRTRQSRIAACAIVIGIIYAVMSLSSAGRLTGDGAVQLTIVAGAGLGAAALAYVALSGRLRPALIAVAVLFAIGTFARSRTYDDSERLWRDTTVKAPNNPRAFDNLASTMFYASPPRLAEAEELYRHAISVDSTYVQAWTGLASVAVDLRRPDEAAWLLERALKISPGYDVAVGHLGTLLLRQGEVDRAIPYLEQFAGATPSDDAYATLGVAYLRARRFPQAVVALRKALELNPSRADVLRNLGGLFIEQGNGADAAPLLERLVAASSPLPIDHGLLSVAYGEMGRVGEAAREANAAASAGANNPAALILAGRAMLLAGKPGEAERLFSGALHLRPSDPEATARLEMARAALRTGKRGT